MQDVTELKHKLKLLEEENVQLMTRIIELREFIFRLSQEIEQYIGSPAFQDILSKRPPAITR